MILLINIFLKQFFFIGISFFPIINSHCLSFKNEDIDRKNYCVIYKPQELNQISYKECLQCYIRFQYIILINQTLGNECKTNFECIELNFYNNTLFENFFHTYVYHLKDLFKISTDLLTRKALYIFIEHDNFKELNLGYIQSIIKPNGKDYSYLFFTLSHHRKQILLDLQTDRSKILLYAIRIQINCDNNTKNVYTLIQYNQSLIYSSNCVTIQSYNNNKSLSTKITTMISSTVTHKLTINLFLFLAGLIVFLVWILCLCLCLYLRYYTWKNKNNLNQRSSIVSSISSVDSFDIQKEDNSNSEQKKQYQSSQQSSRHGLYFFDDDFHI